MPLYLIAQTSTDKSVIKHYYKDNIVSVEVWKGADKKIDSLKTYYKNGNLNEVFYHDEKGLRDSNAYQYNGDGEKLVTWKFSHGKLLSRTDHKLPFNKDSEENVKRMLTQLAELNQRTNYNPININDLYKRGNLRARLGNTTLALDDLNRVDRFVNIKSKDTNIVLTEIQKAGREKFKSTLYDMIANLYMGLEMENYSVQYFYKAMTAAPNDMRILYNFANYLQQKKSIKLAQFYLEKIIATTPQHGHARLAIAKLYSDLGEYSKAMEHITVAFTKEQSIIDHSTNYGGRDLKTTRGLLYHKLGESEKGIKDLKEALKMDPNNSYAMKNLGIIYLNQKKYDEACELFEKAKKIFYTLEYDENDLDALLESACNQKQTEIEIVIPKPFVYPNPAVSVIKIENYDYKNFEFEFFNFESISVLRGNTSDGNIDVSNLNSGFYILKIKNQYSSQTFKIIKQ